MSQLMEGKCLRCASFLSSPQNTCTIPRVADVTGSEKSPPGGDTLHTQWHPGYQTGSRGDAFGHPACSRWKSITHDKCYSNSHNVDIYISFVVTQTTQNTKPEFIKIAISWTVRSIVRSDYPCSHETDRLQKPAQSRHNTRIYTKQYKSKQIQIFVS